MRRLQQEMSIRRRGYLCGNGIGERVRGWEEPAALRAVSRMMGVRAVEAWERGVRCGRVRGEEGGGGEGSGGRLLAGMRMRVRDGLFFLFGRWVGWGWCWGGFGE